MAVLLYACPRKGTSALETSKIVLRRIIEKQQLRVSSVWRWRVPSDASPHNAREREREREIGDWLLSAPAVEAASGYEPVNE